MLVVCDDRIGHERRDVSQADHGEPFDLAPQPIARGGSALSGLGVAPFRARGFERLQHPGKLRVGVVALLTHEWRGGLARARDEGGRERCAQPPVHDPQDILVACAGHYRPVDRSTLLAT